MNAHLTVESPLLRFEMSAVSRCYGSSTNCAVT